MQVSEKKKQVSEEEKKKLFEFTLLSKKQLKIIQNSRKYPRIQVSKK